MDTPFRTTGAAADPASRSTLDDTPIDADGWMNRLQTARLRRLPGDILTWAEEAPSPALAWQARRCAGLLLLEQQQHRLALEQFELALQIDPADRESLEASKLCQARAAAVDDSPAHQPRQVLLFSGHRIDTPQRRIPRFTPEMLPAASQRLNGQLDQLRAGPLDLALCQAAAGGDLMFLEACQSRAVGCRILLPFDEATFIDDSILASIDGAHWLERWRALQAALPEPPRQMPTELGPTPAGSDPYERCNRWLLNTALAFGPQRLRLLCLWNGLDGDGPGGVRHMIDEARRRAGTVRWIDTRTLL